MSLRVARYAAGSLMQAHHHEQAWLCLLIHGAYEERICSRTQKHRPGDVLFCPAHTPHEQRFGPRGAVKILFAPDEARLDYLAEAGVELRAAPYVHSPVATRTGLRLQQELAMEDPFSTMAAEGLALELIALFARGQTHRSSSSPPRWLQRVKETLDANAGKPGTLDALASDVGRHPVHLAREFRRHYGQTTGAYLRHVRAQRAAAMLRATNVPLIEIALTCGYGGPAQFSRSFRAVYGVTPSAYRLLSR